MQTRCPLHHHHQLLLPEWLNRLGTGSRIGAQLSLRGCCAIRNTGTAATAAERAAERLQRAGHALQETAGVNPRLRAVGGS